MEGKINMGDFFVHETGICESTNIGSRTRIGAFSRVLPAAEIGRLAAASP